MSLETLIDDNRRVIEAEHAPVAQRPLHRGRHRLGRFLALEVTLLCAAIGHVRPAAPSALRGSYVWTSASPPSGSRRRP